MQIVRHSINFYLRNPQLESCALTVLIQWKGHQIRKGCGMAVQTKFWDNNHQRVKPTATGAREINIQIDHVKSQITNLFKVYAAQNPDAPAPPKEHVNNALLLALGRKSTDTSTFLGFIEQHTLDRQKEKNISVERIYRLLQTVKYLKDFAADTRKKIDFDTLTGSTAKEFVNYLYNSKEMTTGSAKTYLTVYIYFLKKAARAGHITNAERIMPERAEMPKGNNSFAVYLTYTEILKLATLDLSNQPMYEKVRDLFLIGCATGLRHSDYQKVTPEAIIGNNIKIFMQKSKKYVTMPASQTVKDMLKKYGNSLPDFSLVHFNKIIKKVCKMAGITDVTEYTKATAGGVTVAGKKAKYLFVSSHTARRSYATNAYKTGVPINVICHVLGHSNITTTEKYLRLTEEEKTAAAHRYAQLADFEAGAVIERQQNMKIAK
ncbi:hypothetical protein C7N43_22525 [Sphingobacteriales bacterium UPWRP_1]|nr:hypothetical protein B6N25_06315 [Sphingobacteriales bacterium TSM_CSS]PSJ74723.1 hypothetical protein C7N43_22525 [Sphingobacteriales bacterium UPWRP_1]